MHSFCVCLFDRTRTKRVKAYHHIRLHFQIRSLSATYDNGTFVESNYWYYAYASKLTVKNNINYVYRELGYNDFSDITNIFFFVNTFPAYIVVPSTEKNNNKKQNENNNNDEKVKTEL